MDVPSQPNLNNLTLANKPAGSSMLGATHEANVSGASQPPTPLPTLPPTPPRFVPTPPPLPTPPRRIVPPPPPPLPTEVSTKAGLPTEVSTKASLPTGSPAKVWPHSFESLRGGAPTEISSSAEKTAEVNTPPFSSPSINIRTLASDAASLRASGGVAIKPQTIKLEAIEELPTLEPFTTNQLPTGVAEKESRAVRTTLKIIGALLAMAALVALGYYVVYPWFFSTPIDSVAGVPGLPSVPPNGLLTATAPAAVQRSSLFSVPPASQESVVLTGLSMLDIIDSWRPISQSVAPVGSVEEVVLSYADGPISASSYLSVLAPVISSADWESLVENNFTSFLYYDSDGAWPGYVMELKAGVTAASASGLLSRLEAGDISRFYLSSPGQRGEFKTGPIGGFPVRYAKFSVLGASFNYGVVGDYVIFSTSFAGFKAAMGLLGI